MKSERENLIFAFVEEVHRDQTYGNAPYGVHLDAVEVMLAQAGMTTESDRIIARAHDAIEDSRDDDHRAEVTAFLREHTTTFEFRMIWALTGIGHNRKTRNADAKAKITADPAAADYKLADRIVNWRFAKGSHAEMYRREDAAFYESVVKLASNGYLIAEYSRLRGG